MSEQGSQVESDAQDNVADACWSLPVFLAVESLEPEQDLAWREKSSWSWTCVAAALRFMVG